MNKKNITAAILSLGLLQCTSTAYADGDNDGVILTQNLGGTGDGPISYAGFEDIGDIIDPDFTTIGEPKGGLAVKLNCRLDLRGDFDEHDKLRIKKGNCHGDAFIIETFKRDPIRKENVRVWCDVHPVKKIDNQFWFDCDYFALYDKDGKDRDWDWNKDWGMERPIMPIPEFTSKGQCYMDVDLSLSDLFKMKDRNAACNFLYKFPQGLQPLEEIDLKYVDGRDFIITDKVAPVAFQLLFSNNSLT